MIWFLVGAGLLVVGVVGVRAFANANPADLARGARVIGPVLLLLMAGMLAIAGQWIIAAPLAAFAFSVLGLSGNRGATAGRTQHRTRRGTPGGERSAAGQSSTVRTDLLELRLHHDTGAIDGRVLSGCFASRDLAGLDQTELRALWRVATRDPENRRLFEAYLDGRLPGWREHFEADDGAGGGGAESPFGPGAMSKQEAHQILGIEAGASDEEVRAAHRRLMKSVHPDTGGSSFLAAKINQAKDTLLRGR